MRAYGSNQEQLPLGHDGVMSLVTHELRNRHFRVQNASLHAAGRNLTAWRDRAAPLKLETAR